VKQTNSKKQSSRYGLPVRIMALALSILVTGGALTYLIMLILQLF
jgi:hypothetical protein